MKISVLTSQNVEIDYEVASIGDRVVAALIDWAILTALIIGLLMIGGLAAASGGDAMATIFGILLILGWVGAIFYPLICEITMQGQTFGKRIRKLRVVKVDGSQPTISSYLLRWLLGLIENGGLGLIVMLANGKGQRLGDMAAGTTVIRLDDQQSLSDTIHVMIAEDYMPAFPQVTRLTDKDIATIREVMDDCVSTGNTAGLSLLARKIKEILAIDSTLPPYDFLQRVMKDYNYYGGRE